MVVNLLFHNVGVSKCFKATLALSDFTDPNIGRPGQSISRTGSVKPRLSNLSLLETLNLQCKTLYS